MTGMPAFLSNQANTLAQRDQLGVGTQKNRLNETVPWAPKTHIQIVTNYVTSLWLCTKYTPFNNELILHTCISKLIHYKLFI